LLLCFWTPFSIQDKNHTSIWYNIPKHPNIYSCLSLIKLDSGKTPICLRWITRLYGLLHERIHVDQHNLIDSGYESTFKHWIDAKSQQHPMTNSDTHTHCWLNRLWNQLARLL
jgi:hypothetical protein